MSILEIFLLAAALSMDAFAVAVASGCAVRSATLRRYVRVGGAFVWAEHANVIIRGEGATASDVLALARLLAARVWLRLGVRLEPEVCGICVR